MYAPWIRSSMGIVFPTQLFVTSFNIESPYADEARTRYGNEQRGRGGACWWRIKPGFNLDDLLLCHAWTMPSVAVKGGTDAGDIDRPNDPRSRDFHGTSPSDSFTFGFLQATRLEPYGSR